MSELETLSGLEIPAAGGTHRLFNVRLADGTTVLVSLQRVNYRTIDPVPAAPSNNDIHETISRLASARAFS